MVWEQELYNQFSYVAARPYFHTFEADVSETFQPLLSLKFLSKIHKIPSKVCTATYLFASELFVSQETGLFGKPGNPCCLSMG